jgi:flagellar biosynthetic protein FliP
VNVNSAVNALAGAGAGHASAAGPTSGVQMALVLSLITLLPGIVLTCTCFARFLIVFSMLKTGLGTQGAPPNQVLVGLALFMTSFVMAPVGAAAWKDGVQPYLAGQFDESRAIDAMTPPVRTFLLRHTRQKDLALFFDVSGASRPRNAADVPLRIAVPAFAISELRTAFSMGLLVLLPFLVIDLVVATVLSALGLVMLPPAVVSMPVKLLVFIAADGWHLIVKSLLRGVMT